MANHYAFKYRIVSIFALLSMLFNLVQPWALAASDFQVADSPSQEATTPVAPSEQARDWPSPELPGNEPASPFLDPTSLAIESTLGDIVDPELFAGGGLLPLEPLSPDPLRLVNTSLPPWPQPTLLETLAKPNAGVQLNNGLPPDPDSIISALKAPVNAPDLNLRPTDLIVLANQGADFEKRLGFTENQQQIRDGSASASPSSPSKGETTQDTPRPIDVSEQLFGRKPDVVTSQLTGAVHIFITETGFVAPVVTTTVNSTVIWTNQTNRVQRISLGRPSLTNIFLPIILKNLGGNQSTPAILPPQNFEPNVQSGDIPPDGTFEFTFTKAGEYPYYLVDSPTITGLVIVQSPPTNLPPQPLPSTAMARVRIDLDKGGHLAVNGIRITMPENALAPETNLDSFTLHYKYINTPRIQASHIVGNIFELTARKNTGEPVSQFNQPFSLEKQLSNAELAGVNDPDALSFYYYDQDNQEWLAVESTFNQETKTLLASVDHFTVFVAADTDPNNIQNAALVNPLIVDNSDPEPFFVFDGQTDADQPEFEGIIGAGWNGSATFTFNSINTTPHNWGTWSVTDTLLTGSQEIFVTIPEAIITNPETGQVVPLTTAAVYEVTHAGGTTPVTVDQQTNAGGEVSLGTFTFNGSGSVYLSDVVAEQDAYYLSAIVFDAVSFGASFGPNLDLTPPLIENVKAVPNQGTFIIEATVTDNVGLADVILEFNGNFYPMTTNGNDIYSAQIPYNQNEELFYRIRAIDTSGNQAVWDPVRGYYTWGIYGTNLGMPPWMIGSQAGLSGSCGNAKPPCSVNSNTQVSGDPVNTLNGNLIDQQKLLTIPGRPDLDLHLTYNAQNGVETIFGFNWTHSYLYHLIPMDNQFFSGAFVQFPDGRVVVFEGADYTPEPGNFETLEKSGSEFILTFKDLSQVTFNAEGDITHWEDANGNGLTFAYEDTVPFTLISRLSTITTDGGAVVTFHYNQSDLVESIDAPEGKTLSFAYTEDEEGDYGEVVNTPHDLLTIIDSRGNPIGFAYDEDHNLEKKVSPEGHPYFENTYDGEKRVTQQTIPHEGVTFSQSFTYGPDKTTTTDTHGHSLTYEYNHEALLTTLTDANGDSLEYTYTPQKQIKTFTDRNGNAYEYDYDEKGNRTLEIDPFDFETTWTYDLTFNKPLHEKFKQDDHVTDWEYDPQGNLKIVTNAKGDTAEFIYNSFGQLTSETDFNGNTTTYTYTPLGNVETITTPEVNGISATASFTYDGLGRVIIYTDFNGVAYHYDYDGNDNLLTVTGPTVEAGIYQLSFTYDKNNRLKTQTDTNGGTTTFAYDTAENLTKVTDQLGFEKTFTYGPMNELLTETDEEGRVTQYTYHPTYLLKSKTVAVGTAEEATTTIEYDGNYNLIEAVDALGRITTFEYDELNRQTAQVRNNTGPIADADHKVRTEWVYSPTNALNAVVDANGNRTEYEHDVLDQVTKITDAENQITQLTYDPNGNLSTRKNPRGYTTTLTYDPRNRLETMTDPKSHQEFFTYDPNSNLIAFQDKNGVVTAYEYDALNRRTATIANSLPGEPASASVNVKTQYHYDRHGNLTQLTNPRGFSTYFAYDPTHRLTTTTDALNNPITYQYDRTDLLIRLTDRRGFSQTYGYDGQKRLNEYRNQEDHLTSFAYDLLGNLLVLTDARGYATTFTYDGLNRPILRVDALQGQWRTEYGPLGNVLRQIDANNHANNTYTYDRVYRLRTGTDAEGHTTEYQYDENGNVRFLIDGNAHTTEYTYDELDRLETMTNPETETTRYRYDPVGNQTHLIEADDIVTLYDYDPLYRLVMVTQNYIPGQQESADVNVDTHYGYDAVGNLLSILNAEENPTTFSYDGLNRLVKEVDALENTWDYEYDPVGNRTVRIDANRQRTEYAYYPDNQLKRIDYHPSTGSGQASTFVEYTYDKNNNRLTMVDHLGLTTWAYDPLNRLTNQTDPFDRHLGYAYDPVSNRTGLTYADGRTVNYTYYDNNWLKEAIDPEGNVTAYDRDGVGQMIRTLNPNNTLTEATYDRANRLLTLTNIEVAGKVNSAFSYTYDEVGQRTQMVAEYGWRNPPIVTSDYTYDPLRRLIRDEDSEGRWTEYEFDRVGNRLALRTNDDSLSPRPFDEKTLQYSYNEINQLLTILGDTHPGQAQTKREDNVGQALYAFRHEVTAQRGKHISEPAADDLLAMADALIADLESKPTPKENEIASAIEALRNQVVTYRNSGDIDRDGIENSLLVKLDKGDQANTGASGDLQTTTFSYDANGNRINKEFPGPQGPQVQGTDYSYDPENRLVEAQDYQMNQQGNRVDRAVTTLDYDGGGRRLVKEYDPKGGGGGAKRVEYVFDGLDPVAEYSIWNPQYDNFYRGELNRIITMHHFPSGSQGQMYWYHYDGLDSTAGLTKQNGNSHHNYRYEPYGQIEMPPGNFSDPHNHYTLTGKEWDEHTELYYFGARHYDPTVGVWLTQDTYRGKIRDPRTLQRYMYNAASPINYVDSYGYYLGESFVNAAGAAVGGVTNATVELVQTSATVVVEAGKAAVHAGQQEIEKIANAQYSGMYVTNDELKGIQEMDRARAEKNLQKHINTKVNELIAAGDCSKLGWYYEQYAMSKQYEYLAYGQYRQLQDKIYQQEDEFRIGTQFWESVGYVASKPVELWNAYQAWGDELDYENYLRFKEGWENFYGDGYVYTYEQYQREQEAMMSMVIAMSFPSPRQVPTTYSVAYEVKISSELYPGMSRAQHFKEANRLLLEAMESDPSLARYIKDLGIEVKAGASSPEGWTWHHATEEGILQLVPREQHAPGSLWQYLLHPGGKGGMAIWGK